MARKSKQPEQIETAPQFGYNFKLTPYCYHCESSDEEYGPWSKSTSWSEADNVTRTDEYPDITSTLDLQSGETAYVVWAQWGSGDSFGHADGASAEALGIFRDAKAANELREFADQMEDHTSTCITSDGQATLVCAGWHGYFENLESVEVATVTVK